jgi:hypothetical protein
LSANGASKVLRKVRTVADAAAGNGALGQWSITRGVVYVLHSISAVVAVGEGRRAVLTAE